MILKELVAYADRLEREGRALPFMYAPQKIKWLVDIRVDGSFRGLSRSVGENIGKRVLPRTFNAPKVVRGVNIEPKILVDKAEFIFGLGDGNSERLLNQRLAFLELTRQCFIHTGNSSIGAVTRWLENVDPSAFYQDHLAVEEDYKSSDQFAFQVEGKLLFELPEVQSFWAELRTPAEDEGVGISLVSATEVTTARIEPVKIVGIRGGKNEKNYISANKDSFKSYGLDQARIAPVGFHEARKYAGALNHLLANHTTSLSIAELTYVFWTSEGATPPVAEIVMDPKSVVDALKKRGRLSTLTP